MESVRHIPKEFLQIHVGRNNEDFDGSIQRLETQKTYRDLSTIWLTPTRGTLKPRVVTSWMSLMRPMNQLFLGPLFIEGEEVGVAYQKGFDMILDHPELSKWSYILTVEDDNLPSPDGVMKLYEDMDKGYDCVGGLYWTKSSADSEIYSQPMIYGDPKIMPRNFIPQVPIPDTLMPCNGAGMGFNLWKIESLKTKLKDMPKPWFRTIQEVGRAYTQDLWFYQEAAKFGFRIAVDTQIRVGHLASDGIVW